MFLRPLMLVAALMAATILPTVAWAAAPVKETTISGSFVVSEESCGFAVAVEPRHDKLRLFTFADGRELLTASYLATATNLDTGKAIQVNLSGQGVFTPNPNGGIFTTTGNTLLSDPGSLRLIAGPITFELDANGNLIRTVVSQRARDVCAALS